MQSTIECFLLMIDKCFAYISEIELHPGSFVKSDQKNNIFRNREKRKVAGSIDTELQY